MKRYLLLSLITVIGINTSTAQKDKKIDEIMFLYVDEKYDKVVDKSLALTEQEDYRKNPLPLIYASMGYYQISRLPAKYDIAKGGKYENPLKNAQKYLASFIKKDAKTNEHYNNYKEYYDLLSDTSNKLGQHFFLMEQYSKSAGAYKAAVKALPNDPVLLLWQSIGEVKSKNFTEGDKNMLAALGKIDENFKPFDPTAGVLAHGMLIVSEYLTQKGDAANASKAKKLIEVFKKYDPDELDKKKLEERKEKAKEDDRIIRKFYSEEEQKSGEY